MKRNIVLTAFIGMLSFAGLTAGQTKPDRSAEPVDHTIYVPFHVIRARSSRSSSTQESAVFDYPGIESGKTQLFEAVIPASTPEDCLAARDFSTAVPVGPEIASITFDRITNKNTVNWSIERRGPAVCRVLLVRTGDQTSDRNIFRGYYEITDPDEDVRQTLNFTKVMLRTDTSYSADQ